MDNIVIELPADLKPLEMPMRRMAEAALRAVIAGQAGPRAVDYARTEAQFAAHAAAIEAASHRVTLQALDIDEPQLMIGGKLYTQVLRCAGTFLTMVGPVSVEEHSRYRAVGERNAPTVDAISLRIGAVGDGWLPATAAAMAHAVQQGTRAKQRRITSTSIACRTLALRLRTSLTSSAAISSRSVTKSKTRSSNATRCPLKLDASASPSTA